MELAHSLPMSGNLGVDKTQDRIVQICYWPKLRRSVAEFCENLSCGSNGW